MKKSELTEILNDVKTGKLSVDGAVDKIKLEPFQDIGYAKVDTQRELRQGVAEVIYGMGKTAEQISGIVNEMNRQGQDRILITKISKEKARKLSKSIKFDYYEEAQIGIVGGIPKPSEREHAGNTAGCRRGYRGDCKLHEEHCTDKGELRKT